MLIEQIIFVNLLVMSVNNTKHLFQQKTFNYNSRKIFKILTFIQSCYRIILHYFSLKLNAEECVDSAVLKILSNSFLYQFFFSLGTRFGHPNWYQHLRPCRYATQTWLSHSGPILESKDMWAFFQKKGKM